MERTVGVILIAIGLSIVLIAGLYGASVRDNCRDKGGVLIQGECVKVEILK